MNAFSFGKSTLLSLTFLAFFNCFGAVQPQAPEHCSEKFQSYSTTLLGCEEVKEYNTSHYIAYRVYRWNSRPIGFNIPNNPADFDYLLSNLYIDSTMKCTKECFKNKETGHIVFTDHSKGGLTSMAYADEDHESDAKCAYTELESIWKSHPLEMHASPEELVRYDEYLTKREDLVIREWEKFFKMEYSRKNHHS